MVIAEGAALITGIKGTIDIVKGLKSSYDTNTIMQAQTQILEHLLALQIDAFTLQEKHSALIHENEEYKKKLIEFEQWGKTASEYELKEINPGVFAYTLKESQQTTELSHWLCPNCWEDHKKSILQKINRTHNVSIYNTTHKCPRCNLSL